MIALSLLILTIWFSYKSIVTKSSFYQLLTVMVDGAWIIYNVYTHSYWIAMIWVVLIALDTRTYQRYKSIEEGNEQEED
jgi:hypothetical protein